MAETRAADLPDVCLARPIPQTMGSAGRGVAEMWQCGGTRMAAPPTPMPQTGTGTGRGTRLSALLPFFPLPPLPPGSRWVPPCMGPLSHGSGRVPCPVAGRRHTYPYPLRSGPMGFGSGMVPGWVGHGNSARNFFRGVPQIPKSPRLPVCLLEKPVGCICAKGRIFSFREKSFCTPTFSNSRQSGNWKPLKSSYHDTN